MRLMAPAHQWPIRMLMDANKRNFAHLSSILIFVVDNVTEDYLRVGRKFNTRFLVDEYLLFICNGQS